MTEATVHLQLDGLMDHLRVAWQTGETLLSSVPFPEDPEGTRYNVLLSIQELLTNVFRHGYAGNQSMPIQIGMEVSSEGFSVEIRDRGVRFDPVAYHSVPPESADGEEVVSGGYGLVIVKMVMDEFDYSYENGWNVVRASKSVHATVAAGAAEEQA